MSLITCIPFRPPRVAVSPEIDWLLLRAFGDPSQSEVLEEKVDAESTLEFGRVLSLLARVRSQNTRQQIETELGGSAADLVDRTWHQLAASAMRHEEVCRRIAALAAEPEILIIFLKGMALQLTGITRPGSRVTLDIDVLVPADRAEALHQILLAAGSQASGFRGTDQHLSVMTHDLGAPIEVHHTLRGIDLGNGEAATADRCVDDALVDTAPDFPKHAFVTAEPLTVAHLLVHAISLHGRAPGNYPGFQFLGDLQDLGYSPNGGKQIAAESQRWIEGEVSQELVDAAVVLLGRLENGERASQIVCGDDGAATLLRHLISGATDEDYGVSLKLSNQLQSGAGQLREDWPTRIWRAVWLKPAQIDVLYGKPKSQLGYLGWRMWRPFHLVGKSVASAAAWLKIKGSGR